MGHLSAALEVAARRHLVVVYGGVLWLRPLECSDGNSLFICRAKLRLASVSRRYKSTRQELRVSRNTADVEFMPRRDIREGGGVPWTAMAASSPFVRRGYLGVGGPGGFGDEAVASEFDDEPGNLSHRWWVCLLPVVARR